MPLGIGTGVRSRDIEQELVALRPFEAFVGDQILDTIFQGLGGIFGVSVHCDEGTE